MGAAGAAGGLDDPVFRVGRRLAPQRRMRDAEFGAIGGQRSRVLDPPDRRAVVAGERKSVRRARRRVSGWRSKPEPSTSATGRSSPAQRLQRVERCGPRRCRCADRRAAWRCVRPAPPCRYRRRSPRPAGDSRRAAPLPPAPGRRSPRSERDRGLFGNLAGKGKCILEIEGDRLIGLDHLFEQTELDLVFDVADSKRADADSLCRFDRVAIGVDGQPLDAGRRNRIDVGGDQQVVCCGELRLARAPARRPWRRRARPRCASTTACFPASVEPSAASTSTRTASSSRRRSSAPARRRHGRRW